MLLGMLGYCLILGIAIGNALGFRNALDTGASARRKAEEPEGAEKELDVRGLRFVPPCRGYTRA